MTAPKPNSIAILCTAAFFTKFLLFDIIWCCGSSFSSFSYPTTYLSKLFIALLLVLPLFAKLPRILIIAESAAVDMLLAANLMYFRTYYTAIPAHSYLLAGNLADFTAAVTDSIRWYDALFPAITLLVGIALYKLPRYSPTRRQLKLYAAATVVCGMTIALLMIAQGGFRKAYGKMLFHRQMSATPTYSVFGTLVYEALDRTPEMTPRLTGEIDLFLTRTAGQAPFTPATTRTPHTVIVLLLESFESWVLEREVDGVEITPRLNALLQEPNTLYAPHVLTQVKGGRSIDAQLLITAGLLPINDGCYSSRYPYSTYETLVKAFRTRHNGARALSFTPDKQTSWNQMIMAPQFGFDRLYSRDDFSRNTLTGHGNHKRLADGPFLDECLGKISEIARENNGETPLYIQCITYSGHAPFIIPEELKAVHFSSDIPRKMADYMTAANYTDSAVGHFIDGIRTNPQLSDALIMITGDHEGLASIRQSLTADKAGAGVVSEHCFTPFIVLNSPAAIRYQDVMGQIDIYPTMLDLLGLENCNWRGLGRSILREDTHRGAVSPSGVLTGDDSNQELLRQAWNFSDIIIRGNYFGIKNSATQSVAAKQVN